MTGLDFLGDSKAAAEYLNTRKADATDAAARLVFIPSNSLPHIMHCNLFGHSILWDLTGWALGGSAYELMPRGSEDVYRCDKLNEIVAFILKRNY